MKLAIDVAIGCVCHYGQNSIEDRPEWKSASSAEKYQILEKFNSISKWSESLTYEINGELCGELHEYKVVLDSKKEIRIPDTSESPLYLCYVSTCDGKTYTWNDIDSFEPSRVVIENFEMPDYLCDAWKHKKIQCFSKITYDGKAPDKDMIDTNCQSYGRVNKIGS